MQNQAWVIQKPSVGRYRPDVLRLEQRQVPAPAEGELLVRTLYISLDPSNLVWLKLLPGWMEDVKVGDIMKGPSLGVVEISRHPAYAPGDIVTGPLQWRPRSVVQGALVRGIAAAPNAPLADHLTIYSHVGRAAYIGMMIVGRVRPGDTVLVSGAAGATGSVAAQLAKHVGARVVGIAGGAEKCAFLAETLGLDATVDYRNEELAAGFARTCPNGIDMYFDNVGGETLDTALLHMKVHGRISICGTISQYSGNEYSQPYRLGNMFYMLMKRIRMEGFVTPDFSDRYDEMDHALAKAAIKARVHWLDGLDKAADGLELLVTGGNHGKLLVKLADS